MKYLTGADLYQRLFERIADDFVGIVEAEEVSEEQCRLKFFDTEGELWSQVSLKYVDLGDSPRDVCRLVEVLSEERGVNVPVLVTPVTSALIAVCTR